MKRERRDIGTVVVAALWITCCAAGHDPAPGRSACLAESVTTLEVLSSVPKCAPGDLVCRVKCRVGDAASCLGLAYSADHADGDVQLLYERACRLGVANGCTNYAATVWARESSAERLACARRLFEKACAVKEQFACGMVGRHMLEAEASVDLAESRRYLETACDQVGGFSCRVLARHLESGKDGTPRVDLTPSLLKRACAGGDVYACGDPATAEETFH